MEKRGWIDRYFNPEPTEEELAELRKMLEERLKWCAQCERRVGATEIRRCACSACPMGSK